MRSGNSRRKSGRWLWFLDFAHNHRIIHALACDLHCAIRADVRFILAALMLWPASASCPEIEEPGSNLNRFPLALDPESGNQHSGNHAVCLLDHPHLQETVM